MSIRSRLKKDIYKAKQSGRDTTILEEKLASMPYTNVQQIQMIREEIIRLMNSSNPHMPTIYELEESIIKLNNSIWILPYHIKRELDKIDTYLQVILTKFLSPTSPRSITLSSLSPNGRYIKLIIDGEKRRFNLQRKKITKKYELYKIY